MAGEVCQVLFQETDDLGRFFGVEEIPVLGIERIARCEILLGLDDELREVRLAVYLDDAHAEVRRDLVVRVQADE